MELVHTETSTGNTKNYVETFFIVVLVPFEHDNEYLVDGSL